MRHHHQRTKQSLWLPSMQLVHEPIVRGISSHAVLCIVCYNLNLLTVILITLGRHIDDYTTLV